jgi:glucose/arabinose dehydrogenase
MDWVFINWPSVTEPRLNWSFRNPITPPVPVMFTSHPNITPGNSISDCAKMIAPVQLLGAHVAPLVVNFYTGSAFPANYRHQIFIAEHGSWNRSEKSGYRITRVKLGADRAVAYEPFVVGFKRGEEVLGRPVDLLILEDGSMLISDDHAGALYRLTYVGPQAS